MSNNRGWVTSSRIITICLFRHERDSQSLRQAARRTTALRGSSNYTFAGKEPSTSLLLPAGRGKVPGTSLSPITTFHTVRKDPSTSLLLTAGRSKELSTSFPAVEQESHA